MLLAIISANLNKGYFKALQSFSRQFMIKLPFIGVV